MKHKHSDTMSKIKTELQGLVNEISELPERIKYLQEPDLKRATDHLSDAETRFNDNDFEEYASEIEHSITALNDIKNEEGLTQPQIQVIKWIESFPSDLDWHIEEMDKEKK